MIKKFVFFNKTLVICIILLFVGVSNLSAVKTNFESKKYIDDFKNPSSNIEIFYPTDDAKISQDDPNKNYDGELGINIRNEYGIGGSSGWASQGLYKFDISSIPSGVSIIKAKFYLFYNKWTSTNPAGRCLNLYRVTSNWDENSITWNTVPSYNPVTSAYSQVPPTVNIWMDWDVTVDIKKFLSGTQNFGWILTDDNYWGTVNIPLSQFRTREFSQELSPYLEIEYTKSRNKDITNNFFLKLLEYFPLISHLLRNTIIWLY